MATKKKTATLHDAAQAFLKHLESLGKKPATIFTYGKDLQLAEEFFGADKPLSGILAPHVGRFVGSDRLRKLPNGKVRADRTVDKTMRVFRMFLLWAQETGRIESLPLPKDYPMGHGAIGQASEESDA